MLDFPNIQQVISFAKTVDYDVEASELFKESDAYHMTVLLNLEDKPDYYADLMFAECWSMLVEEQRHVLIY